MRKKIKYKKMSACNKNHVDDNGQVNHGLVEDEQRGGKYLLLNYIVSLLNVFD